MDLTKLTDAELLESTKHLVNNERNLVVLLIHHFREIHRRRLFSEQKCPSLFDFLVRVLKLSEPQAQRRVTAMYMLMDHPEIEEPMKSGALSLTNVNLARTLFNHVKMTGEEQTKILESFANKTTREAKEMACRLAPAMKKPKRFDFSCIEDGLLREKLMVFKNRLSHIKPDVGLAELLHIICDRMDELETKLKPKPKNSSNAKSAAPQSVASMRRETWVEGKGTFQNCGSKKCVQIDHVYPRAAGGKDTRDNMRLLCRHCNLRRAIEFYGIGKMDPFINRAKKELEDLKGPDG